MRSLIKMKKFGLLWAGGLSVSLATSSLAQVPSLQPTAQAARTAAAKQGLAAADFSDAAFDKDVPPDAIFAALKSREPQRLMLVGLRLAVKERELGRKHRAAPAGKVLELAIARARATGDLDTLKFLANLVNKPAAVASSPSAPASKRQAPSRKPQTGSADSLRQGLAAPSRSLDGTGDGLDPALDPPADFGAQASPDASYPGQSDATFAPYSAPGTGSSTAIDANGNTIEINTTQNRDGFAMVDETVTTPAGAVSSDVFGGDARGDKIEVKSVDQPDGTSTVETNLATQDGTTITDRLTTDAQGNQVEVTKTKNADGTETDDTLKIGPNGQLSDTEVKKDASGNVISSTSDDPAAKAQTSTQNPVPGPQSQPPRGQGNPSSSGMSGGGGSSSGRSVGGNASPGSGGFSSGGGSGMSAGGGGMPGGSASSGGSRGGGSPSGMTRSPMAPAMASQPAYQPAPVQAARAQSAMASQPAYQPAPPPQAARASSTVASQPAYQASLPPRYTVPAPPAEAAVAAPRIRFAGPANPKTVSESSLRILAEILREARQPDAVIVGTASDRHSLAVSLQQALEQGRQINETGPAGIVIRVYRRAKAFGLSDAQVVAAMEQAIEGQGSALEWGHCTDLRQRNVIDLHPASLVDAGAVLRAARAHPRIVQAREPVAGHPAIHLVIAQAVPALSSLAAPSRSTPGTDAISGCCCDASKCKQTSVDRREGSLTRVSQVLDFASRDDSQGASGDQGTDPSDDRPYYLARNDDDSSDSPLEIEGLDQLPHADSPAPPSEGSHTLGRFVRAMETIQEDVVEEGLKGAAGGLAGGALLGAITPLPGTAPVFALEGAVGGGMGGMIFGAGEGIYHALRSPSRSEPGNGTSRVVPPSRSKPGDVTSQAVRAAMKATRVAGVFNDARALRRIEAKIRAFPAFTSSDRRQLLGELQRVHTVLSPPVPSAAAARPSAMDKLGARSRGLFDFVEDIGKGIADGVESVASVADDVVEGNLDKVGDDVEKGFEKFGSDVEDTAGELASKDTFNDLVDVGAFAANVLTDPTTTLSGAVAGGIAGLESGGLGGLLKGAEDGAVHSGVGGLADNLVHGLETGNLDGIANGLFNGLAGELGLPPGVGSAAGKALGDVLHGDLEGALGAATTGAIQAAGAEFDLPSSVTSELAGVAGKLERGDVGGATHVAIDGLIQDTLSEAGVPASLTRELEAALKAQQAPPRPAQGNHAAPHRPLPARR